MTDPARRNWVNFTNAAAPSSNFTTHDRESLKNITVILSRSFQKVAHITRPFDVDLVNALS